MKLKSPEQFKALRDLYNIKTFPTCDGFYPYQAELWNAVFRDNYKRICFCGHRRSGKDFACFMIAIAQCLIKPCIVLYFFKDLQQARRAVWDTVDASGKRFLDYIPEELIDGRPHQQSMKIKFKTGSVFQLVGADSAETLRGTNPYMAIFSEWALMNPGVWPIINPAINFLDGVAIFQSTPRGKSNHFYSMFEYAKRSPDWLCLFASVKETGLIPEENIRKEIDAGLMSEDMANQEFYCSWDQGSEGVIYGKYMEKAREEGRIGRVPHDPYLRTYVACDIGFSDATAIVWFQVTQDGCIRIIDYAEDNYKAMPHYVLLIENKAKENDYNYAELFGPWDMGAKKQNSGLSSYDVALELGMDFTIMETYKHHKIDQIRTVRSHFNKIFIDEEKCSKLIINLENYRWAFDKTNGVYKDRPVHDKFSHGADAFAYAVIAKKTLIHTSESSYVGEVQAMLNEYRPIVF